MPRGSLAGFVGPNGAGKTTTFSVVSGFLQPDAGEVDILGEGSFSPHRFKGRLGVLPQDAELPDRHSPAELLIHLARLQGLSAREARREADRLIDLVRLTDRRDARIASLSHGMRRRVAVASALCGSPELVLLDEPMAGLDPSQAHSLRERLVELRGRQTLVISSHDLGEIERMCDWTIMVRLGRCLREGPTAELVGATEISRWDLGGAAVDVDALAARVPGARFTQVDGALEVHASADQLDAATLAVIDALHAARVPLRGMSRGIGLERRFLADEIDS